MLIAAYTNVLLDLAAAVEPVVDAVELLRGRFQGARIIALPTVIQELRFISRYTEVEPHADLAALALEKLTRWGMAEAAFTGCDLFLTSDSHFGDLDFQLLTLELRSANASVPAIVSPRNIVRRFYR